MDFDTEVKGLFLLVLAISGNFIAETLNCKTQKLLSENMYAKHLISLFILFFSITLFNGEEPLKIFIKTISIYILFLLFTRMNLMFTWIVFILLTVYYVVGLYLDYYVKESEKESEKESDKYLEKIKKLHKTKELITKMILIFILTGFTLYFQKQYKDHYKNWSTTKFIFGVRNCNSMK